MLLLQYTYFHSDGWTYYIGTKSYYIRIPESAGPWNVIRTNLCQNLFGGDLASIPDAETCDFLKPLITGGTWVGGYKTGDTWMWTDGTPFNFSNWYSGKPDNGVNIRIGKNGGSEVKFFAEASHRTWPGLCQFRFSNQYEDEYGTGTGTGVGTEVGS